MYVIEISVPLANNSTKKYVEKTQKYADLAYVIGYMWHADNVITVPIIIIAWGEILSKIHESLSKLQF